MSLVLDILFVFAVTVFAITTIASFRNGSYARWTEDLKARGEKKGIYTRK